MLFDNRRVALSFNTEVVITNISQAASLFYVTKYQRSSTLVFRYKVRTYSGTSRFSVVV